MTVLRILRMGTTRMEGRGMQNSWKGGRKRWRGVSEDAGNNGRDNGIKDEWEYVNGVDEWRSFSGGTTLRCG